MPITNASEILFTPDDVANWAIFLNTPTGQRLIPKVVELAPRLLSRGDTNEILIRNGELLGFQAAVQAMLDLANLNQTEQPRADNFPPLPPE